MTLINESSFTLFFLLTAVAPVGAADFRILNFGDDCASVQAQEVAKGSIPLPWKQVSGADIYAFQVRENNRDLVLTYFCPHGRLLTGNYSFPDELLDDADKSYGDALKWLTSMYGVPEYEGLFQPDDPRRRTAVWRVRGMFVSMMTREEAPSRWRVVVTVAKDSSRNRV